MHLVAAIDADSQPGQACTACCGERRAKWNHWEQPSRTDNPATVSDRKRGHTETSRRRAMAQSLRRSMANGPAARRNSASP